MRSESRPNASLADIGWLLMSAVRDIDLGCTRPVNGVENGLCNVRRQFVADVKAGIVAPPPRNVKEEDAITWLLSRVLQPPLEANLRVPYPGSRKTCDLVITLPNLWSLWVEVKLAWKRWFNCDGKFGKSSSYLPYLNGSKHKTHSAADDFAKLVQLSPRESHLGFLLIGFDSIDAPMVDDMRVLSKAAHENGWTADQIAWHDRRNAKCRINCWFWHRSAAGITPER
jgi:hypothetical protein